MDEANKIPEFTLTITGIPSSETIIQTLNNAEKVNELKLKFFPLNGDMDFSNLFGVMTKDLRKFVGSKNGETILKSPQNISGIAKILEEAAGTVEPVIKITTQDKVKKTVREDEITEKYQIEIDDNIDFNVETKRIVCETEKLEVIKFTNNEHDKIYNNNKGKIMEFISKKE